MISSFLRLFQQILWVQRPGRTLKLEIWDSRCPGIWKVCHGWRGKKLSPGRSSLPVGKIQTQMAQGPSFGTFGFDFFFARAFWRKVISGLTCCLRYLKSDLHFRPANIQSQPYHFHPKSSRERANQLGLQMKKRQFLRSQRRTLQKSILPWHWAMMEQLFESTFLDSCCLE